MGERGDWRGRGARALLPAERHTMHRSPQRAPTQSFQGHGCRGPTVLPRPGLGPTRADAMIPPEADPSTARLHMQTRHRLSSPRRGVRPHASKFCERKRCALRSSTSLRGSTSRHVAAVLTRVPLLHPQTPATEQALLWDCFNIVSAPRQCRSRSQRSWPTLV